MTDLQSLTDGELLRRMESLIEYLVGEGATVNAAEVREACSRLAARDDAAPPPAGAPSNGMNAEQWMRSALVDIMDDVAVIVPQAPAGIWSMLAGIYAVAKNATGGGDPDSLPLPDPPAAPPTLSAEELRARLMTWTSKTVGGYGPEWLEGYCAAVREVMAILDAARAPAKEPEPATVERVQRFNDTTGAFSGGNDHADRCICQRKEVGPNAGTPHKHHAAAPHRCARCACAAYVAEVPSAPEPARPPAVTREEFDVLVEWLCDVHDSGDGLTERLRAILARARGQDEAPRDADRRETG